MCSDTLSTTTMSSIWAVSRLAVKGHFSPNQGSRKSAVYTIQSATENTLKTLKWGLLATKEWSTSLQSIRQRFFSWHWNASCLHSLHIYPAIAGFPLILGIRTLDDSWCSYAKLWHDSSMFIYVTNSDVLAETPLDLYRIRLNSHPKNHCIPVPYNNHAYFLYPNIQALQQSRR